MDGSGAETISLNALSRRLGVSARALNREAELGRIPSLKIGNNYIFNARAVDQAIARRAAAGMVRSLASAEEVARSEFLFSSEWYRCAARAGVLPHYKAGTKIYFDTNEVFDVIGRFSRELPSTVWNAIIQGKFHRYHEHLAVTRESTHHFNPNQTSPTGDVSSNEPTKENNRG